jgi:hypothetical protein
MWSVCLALPSNALARRRRGSTVPQARRYSADLRMPVERERKQVAAPFAGVKGCTELIRDLDPEDAPRPPGWAVRAMTLSMSRAEAGVDQVAL